MASSRAGAGDRPAPECVVLCFAVPVVGRGRNTAAGVVILVEGDADAVDRFADLLPDELPASMSAEEIDRAGRGPRHAAFILLPAARRGRSPSRCRPTSRSAASACRMWPRSAIDDNLYPLAELPSCGPRYSIIESMP